MEKNFDKIFDLSNLLNSDKNKTLTAILVEIYLDKKLQSQFLYWLTNEVKNKNINPERVKRIQRLVGSKTTQRLMLNIGKYERPRKKIRLMRANNPLYDKGLCTWGQVLDKEYMFVCEDYDIRDNLDYKLEDKELDILGRSLNLKEKQIMYLLIKSFHIEHIAKFMNLSEDDINNIKAKAISKLKSNSASNNFFGHEYWDKFEK